MNSEQIVAQQDSVENEGLTLLRFAKQPSARMLSPMPILVVYHPVNVAVSVEESGGSILFSLRGASQTWPLIHNAIDAHQLRDAFLSAKTPADALTWMAASGHFRHLYDDDTVTSLTWSDFQLWQEFIRLILSQGLAGVLKRRAEKSEEEKQDHRPLALITHDRFRPLVEQVSDEERTAIYGYQDGLYIQPGSLFLYREYPSSAPLVAEITVSSALEAILATVYVDKIVGTTFRACALHDCSEVFEVSSKHERMYCSQACAHKASVRKRRAEAKAFQEAAAKRATKGNAKKGKG